MSRTLSFTRDIPFDDSWDVVVAGGGPAGCTAAAAAAREGARTLLVEATGALGGMGTLGLVPAWCPFSDKEKIIYTGLAERVFNAAKQGMAHVAPGDLNWVPIDPERLKRVYDDLLQECGAAIRFNTTLSAVETDENGGVQAIIISNKAGLTALGAKVFVDCTGDADLAAWAGAEFHKGDDRNGNLQAATHCFVLSNVDTYAYRHGPQLHAGHKDSPIYEIVRSGKYPLIADTHLCNNLIGPGTVGFNAGHLFDVDNTDPESTSAALIQGRKIAAAFRDALAEYHPRAFADAFLATTASLLGIRETRRIVGDYVLTYRDYIARRSFPDEICRNSYYLDIHKGPKETAGENIPADMEKGDTAYGPGESHGIPYRCLTPRGLRNVVVAGRSISSDRWVQGSVRVMPVCLAMGEAAGMAAAYAAAGAVADVHAVDTDRLRQKLREEGAYLP